MHGGREAGLRGGAVRGAAKQRGVKKRRCAALCLRSRMRSGFRKHNRNGSQNEGTTVDGPHPTVQWCPTPPRRRQRGGRMSVLGGGEVFCPAANWLATAHIGSCHRLNEVAKSHSTPPNAPRQRRRAPPNRRRPPPPGWVLRGMPRLQRPPGHPPTTNWAAWPVPPLLQRTCCKLQGAHAPTAGRSRGSSGRRGAGRRGVCFGVRGRPHRGPLPRC